ncbi:uncharacterized protein LOC126660311 [Mercurialis annua]|uniref:uncharacterized protein LOC126660311 n=1 Tax=Mercurialis annua TaxID=3986 RepID=UPI002160F5C2|nr:uncharacterized protein LOC126660311 [Mercurialis annua]
MLAKLFHKNTAQQPQQPPPPSPSPLPDQPETSKEPAEQEEDNLGIGKLRSEDINPTVDVHYGIPSTASVLAFDPIQSLLAIGTLDGRIKVIGGDNIEGLLVSPKQLPFKNLEFLQNRGFLVSITAENEIQVWDLEQRKLASSLQWESTITAFSIICGSCYMYVGDEYGMVSVLTYDEEEIKLVQLPYYVPQDAIAEASGVSSLNHQSVVGLLPQPASQGNRLLIAYDDGLIILWDASEDKVILTKGNKDLQLKTKSVDDFHNGTGHELSDDISEYEQSDKEISALCWASSDGSVLAVGYVDGDIMFWSLSTSSHTDEMSEKSSNDVVKLQLSSASRRLPVIVLHWSADSPQNDGHSQLFVYGGDAIGSEEVLTILSIDWSSGIKNLKCIGRVDLTLNGTFADMILLRNDGVSETRGTLVLTNPGQLHFYDDASFACLSQQQKQNSVPSIQSPMVIPTVEPYMTVGRLGSVYSDGKLSKALSKTVSAAKVQAAHARRSMTWPLTGGVPSLPHNTENYQVERLYIAGYQDGSVRIWDATNPIFAPVYVLGPEMKGIDIAGTAASISELDFCSFTLSLAIGNELGMVLLYKLIGDTNETSLHLVKESGKEVHTTHQENGPQCIAVFSFSNSPVSCLQFANFGSRLAVGFHCGKVAMLDISTLSVIFVIDTVSNSESPVKSLAVKSFPGTSTEDIEPKSKADHVKSELVVMTKDAQFVTVDGSSGTIISSQSLQSERDLNVISMHIIEDLISDMSNEKQLNVIPNSEANSETDPGVIHFGTTLKIDPETSYSSQRIENCLLLLCFEDELHLHHFKSLHEGDTNPIRKVNLSKPCCWATTFKKNDKECGLIVLYQTGSIEIRSLVDLEVIRENSLMSILRWSFKPNMEKTICSSDTAEILLVNACEFSFISLLACGKKFRFSESLPCLHDKVLAAAADAAMSLSPTHQKTQDFPSGILGGFIKGLQAGKVERNADHLEIYKNNLAHLESIFLNPPYLKPYADIISDDPKVLQLNIDDIDIDEPLVVQYSPEMSKKATKDKRTEKNKLFEGATSDSNPKPRTAEEIKAKYRKEDPATAALRAREKLAERGEKLERLSQRTEELQNGAENFASMASELAKQMEKRKWWNL